MKAAAMSPDTSTSRPGARPTGREGLRTPDSFREPGTDGPRDLTTDPAATTQEGLAERGQSAPAESRQAKHGDDSASYTRAPLQRPPEPRDPSAQDVHAYRARPLSRSGRRAYRTARGLGWFSIALGIAEVLMPHTLARNLGLRSAALVRLCGLREIATGVGLLMARDPAPWTAARVGGDLLDAATLLPAVGPDNPRRGAAIGAMATVAAVTAVDAACTGALRAEQKRQARPVYDYSDRSGFPRPAEQMRGAARDGGAAARIHAVAEQASPR
jgi:hypothetical protein